MGGKTAIAGGLTAGLITGAIVVGAVVLLAPGPGPSDRGRSPDPAAGASATPPGASPIGPAPSGSSSPVVSPGAGEGFGIGQPAPPIAVPHLGGGEIALADGTAAFALPVHRWIDADGIVRDGAFGGIGRDIIARGPESILPGVEVTP
jgi:hypothetical protein